MAGASESTKNYGPAVPRGRFCHRVALVGSALALGLGLLTIVGWSSGWHVLASVRAKYIPMAPSTALGFVFLGAALFAHSRWPGGRPARILSLVGALLATALAITKLIEFSTGVRFGIEELLVRNPEMFGAVPTGRMSPITASNFLLAGTATLSLLFKRIRRLAGVLASAVTAVSALVVLGYLYGTPLLYGGGIIPVALSTALAFLSFGVALLAEAGLERWPLSRLSGASTQALLLRTMLPVTVIGVLLNGALWRMAQAHFRLNPALLSALSALVFAVALSAVIVQVAGIIGRRIDRAEAGRNRAQEDLQILNQQLEKRVADRTAQLARYAETLRARNEQMEEELKMARELQLAMLPQEFPVIPRYALPGDNALQFFKFYYPTGAVSGDFFNIIALSDTSVGIFICDVMGHGVRAALVTAMLRALVGELSPRAADPGALLTEMNRGLANILKTTGTVMYATAFYMVADMARGRMLYANAGHPHPLHLHSPAGTAETTGANGERGPALGLFEDAAYPTAERPLANGDFLLLFTDGLFEVDGPDGQQYSQERLLAAVRARVRLARPELLAQLLEEIQQFSVSKSFADDVCLVGMEVTRVSEEPSEI